MHCIRLGLKNYTINDDGTVDVNDHVYLDTPMVKFPIKFGTINGSFTCTHNKLETLEGCPNHITGSFDCTNNNLYSLEHSPKYVGGFFQCNRNHIDNIIGIGRVGGLIIFSDNQNFYDPIGLTNDNEYYLFDTPIYFLLKLLSTSFRTRLCPIKKKQGDPWNLDRFIDLHQTYEFISGDKIHKHKFIDVCDEFNVTSTSELFSKMMGEIEKIGYTFI
jgi:hypothetical protein